MSPIKNTLHIHLGIALFCLLSMTSCYTYTLQVPTTSNSGQLRDYPYVYIIPTSSVSGSSGVYGTQYRVRGGETMTTNPSEVIAGYLMKKGFTILPELTPELQSNTLIVSYGHTGKRQLSPYAYSNIVLIQFRDAKTHSLVASSEAEGCGDNEAQDILQAITRALDALFNNTPQAQLLN